MPRMDTDGKRTGHRKLITSALESNVGLSAIAHFCAKTYGPGVSIPQGLGTGQLFTDNIPMPLQIKGEKIFVIQV